jgi:hypothetical protein
MPKITDYILIGGYDPLEAAKMVQEAIEQGYQPYGNPFMDRLEFVIQAMVKYEGKK